MGEKKLQGLHILTTNSDMMIPNSLKTYSEISLLAISDSLELEKIYVLKNGMTMAVKHHGYFGDHQFSVNESSAD